MKYISDEELTRAAKKVGEAIRKSLPDPETCRHEFSPEFQKKIEVLKEQGRRKEQKIKYLQRACIAATIALCCTGVMLAANPDARAAVSSWIRSIYENAIVYRFTSDSQETVLPEYEVGYIPDGYEENQVLETHTGKTIIFSNGRDMIFINWYLLSDNMNVEARAVDAELIPDKVNDHDAEWIVPNDSSQTTDLLWTDDRRGVGFIVSGYLERAELLKIAESISCT